MNARARVLLLICTGLVCLTSHASAERPNILFILVDDLGWSDLRCYGHPWHDTPNIDQLAEEGTRFSHAYAPAPICSASRASILTGKSAARVGLEFVVKKKPGHQKIIPAPALSAPPYTLALDLEEVTIAEYLADRGYETAYCGKWHLNPHHEGRYLAWSPTHGPGQQGFMTAVEDFGSHPYSREELKQLNLSGSFYPDGLTQKAVAFLERKREAPFFLMVSHFYVHTPVQTPYEWLLKKYDTRIPKSAKNRDKRLAYASFVETLDHYIGELLQALEDSGQAGNTLVVFMSDNGGHPEFVSNRPLRGSKWNLYEGGIRIPMIVRWPGITTAGVVSDTPVIGYDLFPTFAKAAGAPADIHSLNLDGRSLPVFGEQKQTPLRSLVWHFPYYHPEGKKFGAAKRRIGVNDFAISQTRPHSAIRLGENKLLWFEEDQRAELYDLSIDVSEQNDLSAAKPKETDHLKSVLLRYLDSVDARRAKRSE